MINLMKISEKINGHIENKILETIFEVIDEFNDQDDQEDKIKKSSETILMGQGSDLDSLGLVNLIVAIQGIEDAFDVSITLADERALSQESSPFRTVNSLCEYIFILIKEEMDE